MSDRRLVIAGLVGGGLCLAGRKGLAAVEPPAIRKKTKAQVHYQDAPRDIRSCAICSFFQKPKDCLVMEGDVTRDGFCDLFSIID